MFSTMPVTSAFPMRNARRKSDEPKVRLSGTYSSVPILQVRVGDNAPLSVLSDMLEA